MSQKTKQVVLEKNTWWYYNFGINISSEYTANVEWLSIRKDAFYGSRVYSYDNN